MLLILSFSYYFEAVLIISHLLSIFFSALIPFRVVSLSIDDSKPILIMWDHFSVDFEHLMTLFIVTVMDPILIDLYSMAIFIVFDWIVIGIVLD